jgi:hypothetical protein
MTAAFVTSEPVPAVVGTAMVGRRSASMFSAPCMFRRSSVFSEMTMFAALAVSMALPPPTARKMSHLCSLNRAASLLAAMLLESGGASSNTWAILGCDPLKASSTCLMSPAATTPLSVTSMAFLEPSLSISDGIFFRASCPAMIFPGE